MPDARRKTGKNMKVETDGAEITASPMGSFVDISAGAPSIHIATPIAI